MFLATLTWNWSILIIHDNNSTSYITFLATLTFDPAKNSETPFCRKHSVCTEAEFPISNFRAIQEKERKEWNKAFTAQLFSHASPNLNRTATQQICQKATIQTLSTTTHLSNNLLRLKQAFQIPKRNRPRKRLQTNKQPTNKIQSRKEKRTKEKKRKSPRK